MCVEFTRRVYGPVGRGYEAKATPQWHERTDPHAGGSRAKDNVEVSAGAQLVTAKRAHTRQRHGQERTVARIRGVREETSDRALLRTELPCLQGWGVCGVQDAL